MPKPFILYTVQILGGDTRPILSTRKPTPVKAAGALGLIVPEVLSVKTATEEEVRSFIGETVAIISEASR